MPIQFSNLIAGKTYSRHDLAKEWGYASFHALARGVVTPREDNKIVLFVTKDKPDFAEQYVNSLEGDTLQWEGPTDHFAEQRLIDAERSGEEIHAFYRARHHSDFVYLGKLRLVSSVIHTDKPSSFICQMVEASISGVETSD